MDLVYLMKLLFLVVQCASLVTDFCYAARSLYFVGPGFPVVLLSSPRTLSRMFSPSVLATSLTRSRASKKEALRFPYFRGLLSAPLSGLSGVPRGYIAAPSLPSVIQLCRRHSVLVKHDSAPESACDASTFLPSPGSSAVPSAMSSASHGPVVDGTILLSSLTSVPSWCQAFFTRDRYRRLAVKGVLDLSKSQDSRDKASKPQHAGVGCRSSPEGAEQSLPPEGVCGNQSRDTAATDNSENSSLCHATPSNARGSSVSLSSVCTASSVEDGRVEKGPKKECRENEEEGYGHLLHDLLRAYGGVKDLQYFVSDESGTEECSFEEGHVKRDVSPSQFPSSLKVSHDLSSSEKQHDHFSSVSGTKIPQMIVLCHVGRNVCGHKGVAHGGFTATIMDNSLGYASHFIFSRAATKSLEVKFIRPLLADSLILVDVSVESVDYTAGTCTVVGKIYALKPGAHSPQSTSGVQSKSEEKKESSGPGAVSTKTGAAAVLPPGVWVVATGKAVMVDVTEKWKDIK